MSILYISLLLNVVPLSRKLHFPENCVRRDCNATTNNKSGKLISIESIYFHQVLLFIIFDHSSLNTSYSKQNIVYMANAFLTLELDYVDRIRGWQYNNHFITFTTISYMLWTMVSEKILILRKWLKVIENSDHQLAMISRMDILMNIRHSYEI